MRFLILLFFTFTFSLVFPQKAKNIVSVDATADPMFENILVKLETTADSLIDCKIQIIGSNKKVVTTLNIPNSAKQIDVKMNIAHLLPGNYTCEVYQRNERIYSGDFFKDAIYDEGNGPPVIRPKN